MNDTHPVFKLIALSIVGGVAKALFGPNRPINPIVTNTVTSTVDKVVDKVDKRIPKQSGS